MAVKVNTMAGAADITFHISTGLLFSKENLSSNLGASAKAPSYALSYSKNSLENIQAQKFSQPAWGQYPFSFRKFLFSNIQLITISSFREKFPLIISTKLLGKFTEDTGDTGAPPPQSCGGVQRTQWRNLLTNIFFFNGKDWWQRSTWCNSVDGKVVTSK